MSCVWTLGIFTNNLWDTYSFLHFIDGNIEARGHLSKVQAVNNRTRTPSPWLFNVKANYKITVKNSK